VDEENMEAELEILQKVSSQQLLISFRSPLRTLSENLRPRDWPLIAGAVRELVAEGVETVVVFHGTDTMAYTAAALSFLLSDLEIPIVLTGANIPLVDEDSDAPINALSSLVALQHLQAGVYIVFAGASHLPGLVHLGTCVRKLRASGSAFSSINRPVVAEVDGEFFRPRRLYQPVLQPLRGQAVEERVMQLRLYPGCDLDAAFDSLSRSEARGLVIELYASATGPATAEYSLPLMVERCVTSGVPVVVTTATPLVPSHQFHETTMMIANAGAIFLQGMLPETATVKLMWALAQGGDAEELVSLLREEIAGEFGFADHLLEA
jgi:L-asparaginase/Glu-tRNA(Gln) amidotransferase subunit D